MIKNERQYRITKSQAEMFQKAIDEIEGSTETSKLHPLLQKAQLDALKSQLQDLQEELSEYESLRSGEKSKLKIDSFEALPEALIQARIASGLTQEQLAASIGIKPQQIQRYESTQYKSASLARLLEIIDALDLRSETEMLFASKFSERTILERLGSIGLDSDFVLRRLFPQPPGMFETGEVNDQGFPKRVAEAAEAICRIYQWDPSHLFGKETLQLAGPALAKARFKLPLRLRATGLEAYVFYVHYLALLVLEATPHVAQAKLPLDPQEIRKEILFKYGDFSFESALKYVWSLGIPVLPLNDPGRFHGACWRINGRNVIVLKQRTRSIARWLHDLLHEYFHAASNSNLEQNPIIEDEENGKHEISEEEEAASRFAGAVMLDQRAEELTELSVKEAGGIVHNLKSAVKTVAQNEKVPLDMLANYVAFRLSLQGVNWWGAATNLQTNITDLKCTPRMMLLNHLDLTLLNDIDRDVLLRALEPLVLAFAGKMGSGKSKVSAEVAKALDWKWASFGEYVRIVARSEGLNASSREVLQEIGADLVNKGAEKFCREVLTYFDWHSGEPLVLDGLRHEEIANALRKVIAPLELRIVFLEMNNDVRLNRLQVRDSSTIGRIDDVESHPTEIQVQTTLPEIADLKVRGEKSVSEVVKEIVAWIHQGDGTVEDCLE